MWRITILSILLCSNVLGSLSCTKAAEPKFKVEGPTVLMDPLWGCHGTRVPLNSCDQNTPIGITPQTLLDQIQGQYESIVQWQPPSGPVDHIFEGFSEETITLYLTIDAAENCNNFSYVESHWCNDPMSSCETLSCNSRLEVETKFSLSSSNGSFAEEWQGFLGIVVSRRTGDVTAHTQLPAYSLDTLNGTIDSESFAITDPEWTFHAHEIQIEIKPQANSKLRGRFIIHVLNPLDEPWMNTVAVWPPPDSS